MRLIHTTTLEMKEFCGAIPPYAILSHTWEDGEVSFQEFQDLSTAPMKSGFAKIHGTCKQARKDGLEYCWVDTCCIDKSSSAELSEAINSMFKWYHDAAICYVFLFDISSGNVNQQSIQRDQRIAKIFCSSKWFTRGWTLQELLAPMNILFFSKEWSIIGTKGDMLDILSKASGIQPEFLRTAPIWKASIAKRMSWMAHRMTSRTEDLAYCLLGIFEVNMPLLYGEGSRAFVRLQEEIIKHSDDQSIFCWIWRSEIMREGWSSVLAPCPAVFADAGHFCPTYINDEVLPIRPFNITNAGLSIWLGIISTEDPNLVLGTLQVYPDNVPGRNNLICLPFEVERVLRRLALPSKPFLVRQSAATEPLNKYVTCSTNWNHRNHSALIDPLMSPGDFGILLVNMPSMSAAHHLKMVSKTKNVGYCTEESMVKFSFTGSHAAKNFGMAIFEWNEASCVDFLCLLVGRRVSEGSAPNYYWQCYIHHPEQLTLSQFVEQLLIGTSAITHDVEGALGSTRSISLGPAISYSSACSNTSNFRVAYMSFHGQER